MSETEGHTSWLVPALPPFTSSSSVATVHPISHLRVTRRDLLPYHDVAVTIPMLWPPPGVPSPHAPLCGLVISRLPPAYWISWNWEEQDRGVTATKIMGWLQDWSRQCKTSSICQCQKAGLEKPRDRPKSRETPISKQLSDMNVRLMARRELAVLSNTAHIFWICWIKWSYGKAMHQWT